MSTLARNLHNRNWLIQRLHAELIGPDPSGQITDIREDGSTVFSWQEYRAPKMQLNGEEILWQDPPIKRYGSGLLYPAGITDLTQIAAEADSTTEDIPDDDPGEDIRVDEILEKKAEKAATGLGKITDDTDEQAVNLANSFRPAAMGLSFLADLSVPNENISVRVSFAYYLPRTVKIGDSSDNSPLFERDLWCRIPAKDSEGNIPEVSFTCRELLENQKPLSKWVPGFEGRMEVTVVSRIDLKSQGKDQRLITVSIINRQQRNEGRIDSLCFFQCGFTIKSDSEDSWILPYPEVKRENRLPGDEDEVIRLIYRNRKTFGVGHGCSAEWKDGRPDTVSEIWTECLPKFETSATSADLYTKSGKPIRVSMRKMAGLDPQDDGSNELALLIESYAEWIGDLSDFEGRTELDGIANPIPEDLKETAKLLIEKCDLCLERIQRGIEFINADTDISRSAKEAFKLANLAMLIAQLRASREIRKPSWSDGRLVYDNPITPLNLDEPHEWKGYWRAFQIAFLLMTIPGMCIPEDEERKIVDLIWFPTGGGKTEAYLGLTAFTIFFNRLYGRAPRGADVLMRYTLRLLTAQQFQRAASLFCSMEYLRQQPEWLDKLGDKPFSLGMWVGGTATPNDRAKAIFKLRALQRNPGSENPFVLLKCPWCNAQFGPQEDRASTGSSGRKRGSRASTGQNVYGYQHYRQLGRPDTVAFRCDDSQCEFGGSPLNRKPPLPVVIIDEDLYESPPNLIIGTVDKFAMLAWKPEIRAFFGIGENGEHEGNPPSLIIQDELHLISGPLGSMVGIYESIIEDLCTHVENGNTILPKIVASTATISRADEQVRALYAREKVMLFPPSGLEASDSFFAREDRDLEGNLKPGRMYIGIMAPGHGSLQTTEARTFATLLQNPAIMPVVDGDESERDPWWTLLCFFNSLRELGGAATLLVSDARDYLRVILNRHGIPYTNIRQLLNVEELTSRIRDDHIPLAIQKLEKPFARDPKGYVRHTVEVCLASSIIEVGVDIDRLSLMAIIGQPKTTSQYIQVSSRIGRDSQRPGLVNVLYSQSKPRDRSHFERFRSYHQRLYAQVEPTSVTPFSPPAVDRALHGILVAAVRQTADSLVSSTPRPFPLTDSSELKIRIQNLIRSRIAIVDDEETENVEKILSLRFKEWETWNPKEYGGFGPPPEDAPLIHPAGSQKPVSWAGRSWATLSSLRDVDASCEAEVTDYFNKLHDEEIEQ